MASSILSIQPLGTPWQTIDPFLICVHHVDNYPAGNSDLGPATGTAGHAPGRDFEGKDDWRMYFGHTVPGFPAHPHRGFETITILRKGTVDHSDSLGASARYGEGDVQWLTAGRGIVHSEMFPLLKTGEPNPLELFQIWLNLPARSKMVEPAITMYWAADIPRYAASDEHGQVQLEYIVGAPPREVTTSTVGVAALPAMPENSWAADPAADVAVWSIRMSPGAKWTLPAATGSDTRRQLFFFKGSTLAIDRQDVNQQSAIEVSCSQPVELINGLEACELLMLQGRPIAEPIAQDGPFVMNSEAEIRQAYADYRKTRFGGWSWPSSEPVHGAQEGRFFLH